MDKKQYPDGKCEGCPVPKLYCAMCRNRPKPDPPRRESADIGGEWIFYERKDERKK